MVGKDLALNNLLWLIRHKTKRNQTNYFFDGFYIYHYINPRRLLNA